MVAELVRRGRAAGLDETEDGQPALTEEQVALAYCYAWIRGGNPADTSPTVLSLARDLGVSRPLLYEWLTGTEERKEQLALAREDSGEAHAEEALHILDTADAASYQHANARANFRKWLASVYNRKTFGQQAQAAAVSISIGSLHLEAHKAIKSMSTPLLAQPETVLEPEYEGQECSTHPTEQELSQVLG